MPPPPRYLPPFVPSPLRYRWQIQTRALAPLPQPVGSEKCYLRVSGGLCSRSRLHSAWSYQSPTDYEESTTKRVVVLLMLPVHETDASPNLEISEIVDQPNSILVFASGHLLVTLYDPLPS